jgi:hypothetical protein
MKQKLSSAAMKVAGVPNHGMGRYKDLRTFIGELEKAGELHRIKAEVDWDGEIGAITRAVYKRKGPAVLFENVKGSTIPLFCGAMHKTRNFGIQTIATAICGRRSTISRKRWQMSFRRLR